MSGSSRGVTPTMEKNPRAGNHYRGCMSAEREKGSRQIWTAVTWFALAALAVTGILLEDVSIAIGVGVAAVCALRFGFFPPYAVHSR